MAVAYSEFLNQRRSEHVHPVNRWCAVVANYLPPVAAGAVLLGRWKAGAAIFAIANAVLVIGHVVEGNLRQEIRAFLTHPIWATRSDIAVANATVREALTGKGGTPR